MSKVAGQTRAALLGLLFAVVGFSYALATYGDSSAERSGVQVGTRAIGTLNLRFTNPLIDGDRDLGDVVIGSDFTRFARAVGGVPPYRFESVTSPTLSTLITTAGVLLNGTVTGTIPANFAGTGPVRFTITVSDLTGTGTSVTEFFRLTVVNTTVFRFAIDALPTGQKLTSYVGSLPVINGSAPYRYSVRNLEFFDTVAGVFVPITQSPDVIDPRGTLEDLGLKIAEDGVVFGKPTVAGTFRFVAHASDAGGAGREALSRDSTQVGQPITLVIEENQVVSGPIVSTNIRITGDTVVPGRDSISYRGLVNLNGQTIASLTGEVVSLRLEEYSTPNTAATPTTLDSRGRISRAPRGGPRNTPKVTGNINERGIAIRVRNESFGVQGLLGNLDGKPRQIAVNLRVGDAIIGSEVLLFNVKARGSRFVLTYTLGKNVNLGGAFLLTKVTGKNGGSGTAWRTDFIAVPPAQRGNNNVNSAQFGSFNGAFQAVVCIGPSFVDTIRVGLNRGKVGETSRGNPNGTGEVVSLQMDERRGKSKMQTNFLPAAETGIPTSGANEASFAMKLDLQDSVGTSVYTGEGSLSVFSVPGGWTSSLRR